MATSDPVKTCRRFSAANERIVAGLEQQRERIVQRTAHAPTLRAGPHQELIDLRGDRGNDLDYYIYELARLQDLARAVNETFGHPPEIVDALATFDAAIPALRRIRNPLTHPSDDRRLDDVAWFDAAIELGAAGAVEYLVDPRYDHHDAALDLSHTLAAYLMART